jgi:CBS domain-containing protein
VAGQVEAAFLSGTAPFSELPEPLFDELLRAAEVVFHPGGTRLARAGGPPFEHLHVVVKGVVRIERRGEILRLLERGEIFGFLSMLTGRASLDVVVEEDLVAYRWPATIFRALLADARFARHFAAGTADRLRSSLPATAPPARTDLVLPVERLLRGPAEWVEPGTPVHEAAALMRDRRISSVLVRGDPPGILTDQDLRVRVLAEGRSPEIPVGEVATRPVRTIPAGTPVHQAWRVLLDSAVHHLPVERGGAIEGVVTAHDLLRGSTRGPLELLRRVSQLPSRDRLPGHAAAVAEMASELQAGGLDAVTIAPFAARVNDALLARILRWAEADLGRAPGPYAWLVSGAEGRQEQIVLAGRGDGLVYADEVAGQAERFRALAERVETDLQAAGFPPRPAGFRVAGACGSQAEWVARLEAWMEAPASRLPGWPGEPGDLLDLRRAAGTLDLAPLLAALGAAGRSRSLRRALVRSALELEPPGAMGLRLRGETPEVDLRRQGLEPIVALARCYALEAGSAARTTPERLEAARHAGLLDGQLAGAATEAFRFLLELRLRLKLAALSGGSAPTDRVALAELSAVERSRLKDGLRAARSLQEAAASHLDRAD